MGRKNPPDDGFERWQRIEREFGGESTTSSDVEAEESAGSMLDSDVGQRFGQLLDQAMETQSRVGIRPNDRIGAYCIDRIIGEGGMGKVYLARRADGSFQQKVALKILHRGPADELSYQRFLQERQILAGLRHPNIARLLDGGMIESVPYLVMEWIDGLPLTTYCRRHALAMEERLALTLQICDAVRHAHREGVVHRDLKPSNVLVEAGTVDGARVVVLDFGIARLEHTDQQVTSTGQILGTPGYMSPEQASGATAIDRRSDIFALGILLYELLSDARPFPTDDLPQALSALLSGEFEPLKRHLPQIDADLDTIVSTCLALEPGRRYASVRALMDDINRYLDGRPIAARPVSWVERWVRRARRSPRTAALAFGAVAVIVASLATVTGMGIKYADELKVERNAAVAARQDAEGLLEFMLADLHTGLDQIGRLDLLSDVAQRTLAYYDEKPLEPNVDDLRRRAAALQNAGQVFEEQGEIDLAIATYQRIRSFADKAPTGSYDPERLSIITRVEYSLAGAHSRHGDLDQALKHIRSGVAHAASLRALVDRPPGWETVYFETMSLAGWILREAGEIEEARTLLDDVISFADATSHLAPKPDDWLHKHAVALSYRGLLFYQESDFEQALADFSSALDICQPLVDGDPANTMWREELQLIFGRISMTQFDLGDLDAAMLAARNALEQSRFLVAAEPANANWARELSVAHASVAAIHMETGQWPEAEVGMSASLAISRSRVRQFPDNQSARNDLAWDLLDLGRIRTQLGDHDAAQGFWREAVEVVDQAVATSPDSHYYLHTKLQILVAMGELDQARPIAETLFENGWKPPDFLQLVEDYGLLAEASEP